MRFDLAEYSNGDLFYLLYLMWFAVVGQPLISGQMLVDLGLHKLKIMVICE